MAGSCAKRAEVCRPPSVRVMDQHSLSASAHRASSSHQNQNTLSTHTSLAPPPCGFASWREGRQSQETDGETAMLVCLAWMYSPLRFSSSFLLLSFTTRSLTLSAERGMPCAPALLLMPLAICMSCVPLDENGKLRRPIRLYHSTGRSARVSDFPSLSAIPLSSHLLPRHVFFVELASKKQSWVGYSRQKTATRGGYSAVRWD